MLFTKIIPLRDFRMPFIVGLCLLLSSCGSTKQNENQSSITAIDTLKNTINSTVLLNALNLKIGEPIFYNRNNDLLPFSEISKGKNKLVFFASTYSCFPCLQYQLNILVGLIREYDQELSNNILVLYAHPNYRNLLTLIKKLGLSLDIYWLPGSDIGIDYSINPGPLYFVYLSKNKKFDKIFNPNNQSDNQIIEFIQNDKSKYLAEHENH